MYRLTCTVTAAICIALFGVLLINSGVYIQTYGVSPDSGADFLGRRVAPMFLGFAWLAWAARGVDIGLARDMICYAMAASFAGIALTGLYEFSVGTASVAIVVAAIGELAIAVGFLVGRTR